MKISNLLYFILALFILRLFIKKNKKSIKNHYKKYSLDDIIKLDYELKYKDYVKTIIIEKKDGNYEKALNILDQLEEKDGISATTLNMRAKIYSCQQRFDEAIELYKLTHEYYMKNFRELDIASEQNLYYLQNRNEMSEEEFTNFLKGISGNDNYKLSRKNKSIY